MSNKILNGVEFIQKCLIVDRDGKLLALKRTIGDDYRAGCWDTPGGRFEEGEEVFAAIKREIMEESSLTAHKLLPIHIASGNNHASGLLSGKIAFAVCYLCQDWEGEVMISDEHTEYKWVTPQELMTYDFGHDGGFFVNSIKAYLDSLPQFKL